MRGESGLRYHQKLRRTSWFWDRLVLAVMACIGSNVELRSCTILIVFIPLQAQGVRSLLLGNLAHGEELVVQRSQRDLCTTFNYLIISSLLKVFP